MNRNLCENIREPRAQYDLEFADLCFERNGLQAWLATYRRLNEATCYSFHVACECLEVYQRAFV